jgi:hypothetical protein
VDGVALVVRRRLAADAMRELIVIVEQLLTARGWDRPAAEEWLHRGESSGR